MKISEYNEMMAYLLRPRQKFANGGRIGFQDGINIKEILRNMALDRTYVPPINLAAKGRGLPPGFRKAKQELREEIPDFDELYKRNITYRKKQKLKQKMIDDPEFKQTEMAKKAERRRRRRVAKVEDKVFLTPDEKFLNYQQSLITRQLNDKIKQDPDLILKNPKLIDQLSTTISPDGNIIKVKPNLSQLKERGIFEIEHQRDIFKEGKMKDFPYNRNLIMAPHNRAGGFKQAAESFIEKNPNSPKIKNILEKAVELKITLQPDVPEGTFKTKGIGYKQLPNAVEKFVDVAKSKVPLIVDKNIGLPSSKKDLTMAKKALGFKSSGSQLSVNPFLDPRNILTGLGDVARVLSTPTVAATFAGTTIKENLDKGESLPEAIADPMVGIELLYPELAKKTVGQIAPRGTGILSTIGRVAANPFFRAARAFTPVGAGLTAIGLGKDAYERYQELEAMSPAEREELAKERDEFSFGEFSGA